MLLLETAEGKPVPQGAMVTVNANPAAYEVGLRGEVFAIDIDYPAAVHATWEGGKSVARDCRAASRYSGAENRATDL